MWLESPLRDQPARGEKGALMDLKTVKPAQQAWSLWDEFRAFAFKGNVIDLAVGVIIGGAFGNVVNSLVHNILMPLVGVVMPSKQGYENWAAVIAGKSIPFGRFVGDVVNFFIVALALYLFILKFMVWLTAFRKDEAPEVPPLTKDQALLTEIRDLLKESPRPGQDS
jgi:large conductance mechanosensitive channel